MIAEYYHKFDEQKGTQFVFSDLGTFQPGQWSVYSEIKRKLIEDYGIPAHEIRFIQECKSEKARKSVIAAMNEGSVRVLFGSTSMLGTGVNAQQRAIMVHHLDTPWRNRSTATNSICCTVNRHSSTSSKAERWAQGLSTRVLWTRRTV